MSKNLLLALSLTLLGVHSLLAQDDCQQDMYVFSDFAKARNYEAAYDSWKKVYEACPSMHNATFVYGEYILKDKIEKNRANEAQKQKFVDDLLAMYDKYRATFPNKFGEGELKVKKALLLFDEKKDDSRVFDLLNDAFKNNKGEFANEKALYVYFLKIVDKNKKGENTLQDVFDAYDDISEKIQDEKDKISLEINNLIPKEEANTLTTKEKRSLKNNRIRYGNYEKIEESVSATLGNLADCENLIPLYAKNFDANKENELWLRRAAGKMSDKGCTADPLFEKLVTSLHNLKPSASSAYYLGVLNDKKGSATKAIQYYNESVDLETDNMKKSKILTRIASKYSKGNAVNYANKALSFNPSNSDAHRIIAHAYAESANECGNTTFEKRAIYWVAARAARRGGLDDLAKRYDALAPTKADIFQAGMAGKTISFKCWVGQSITVPNL